MDYKKIAQLKTMVNSLKQTIPATHKELWTIHKAPARIDEAMESAVEMIKWTTMSDYIQSLPEFQKDKAKLAEIQGKIKLHQSRLDAASELEKQLVDIAVSYQIEQEAVKAGAINPKLVLMLFKDEATHTIDPTGGVNVNVGGRSVQDAVQSLATREDTKHLFDSSVTSDNSANDGRNGKSYSGDNPWLRGSGWNLSEQGRIFRQDPTLAGQLKKEAMAG